MALDLIKSDLTIKVSQPKDKSYRLNDGKRLGSSYQVKRIKILAV